MAPFSLWHRCPGEWVVPDCFSERWPPSPETPRILDHRDAMLRAEIPEACSTCGAPIAIGEEASRWYVSGPADLENAAKYGIAGEGWVEVRSLRWECSADIEHEYGPILLAPAQ